MTTVINFIKNSINIKIYGMLKSLWGIRIFFLQFVSYINLYDNLCQITEDQSLEAVPNHSGKSAESRASSFSIQVTKASMRGICRALASQAAA